jgi:peptidyl-prolyl cis-trans isomerase D
MVTERRKGWIVTIPAAAFAPKTPPSEGEVTAWYNDHRAQYALPERRTIRYLTVGDSALKNVPAPTEAEIAARYNANKEKYAATDKRKLSQMVLPTEAAAKQVLAELGAGKTLEASASAKGLGVAALGSVTKDEYALQSSAATAEAVFAAPKGKVAGPFKAPLGWLIVRVDGNDAAAGKTLDQARPELLKELGEEKRRGAIAEFIARIEDELDNGATLADVAKELGVTITETAPLTADGSVYGKPDIAGPKELAPIFQAAYTMEVEKKAQVVEVEPGKTFMIFDVGKIDPAAPPPLAEIRDQVVTDVQLAKGAKAAKAAAENVQKQVEKGVPVEVALASLGISLPPIDRVDKDRTALQAQGQNASKPELLLFAMAKGKVRLLSAPRNRGWYVVSPTEVIPGTVAQDDKRLPGLSQSLQSSHSGEYGEQLGNAMRSDVGATRNEGSVKELEKRLRGGK